MKEQVCCFTGHRQLPREQMDGIAQRLRETVCDLMRQGVVEYWAGGALGFDTLAAQTVLSLKEQYPVLRLNLALPCKEQSLRWDFQDCSQYEEIKVRADWYLYVSEAYSPCCMMRRNRWLVDHSAYCICYCKDASGGTGYTVDYAKKKQLTIINLAQRMKEDIPEQLHF